MAGEALIVQAIYSFKGKNNDEVTSFRCLVFCSLCSPKCVSAVLQER